MSIYVSVIADVASIKSHALAENNTDKSLLAHSILMFSSEKSANLFHFTCATVKCRVSVK